MPYNITEDHVYMIAYSVSAFSCHTILQLWYVDEVAWNNAKGRWKLFG